MFSRLRHLAIRKQVVDLLMIMEEEHEVTGHHEVVNDEEGNTMISEGGGVVLKHVDYIARSREEVEKEFEDRLKVVETDTPFSRGGHAHLGAREVVPVGWELEGKKLTDQQMSAVEAHEKGHYLRPYFGDAVNKMFVGCFDPRHVFSEEDMIKLREEWKGTPDDDIRELVAYKILNPMEATERMAQLKNYFGFRRGERFTATHLAYARDHYIPDTGNDNGMTIFFRAIIKKTEKEFLKVINSAGI